MTSTGGRSESRTIFVWPARPPTRYWFRSLPTAPKKVVTVKAERAWDGIDERAFSTLVRNYEE